MKVSEVMTASPECVDSTVKLSDAASKLFELDVRHLPVLESGQLVGIISDRDFINAKVEDDSLPLVSEFEADEREVRAIMRSEPYSVTADAELSELIDLMLEQKLSAVPVIDSRQTVIGIVSYIDILKAVRSSL